MSRFVLAFFLCVAASASGATVRLRVHNATGVYVYVGLNGGGLDLDGYFGPGESKFFTREILAGDVSGQVNATGLSLDGQLQEGLLSADGTETALECYVEPVSGALNFAPLASVDVTGWPMSWDYAAASYAFAFGFFLFLGFGVWRSIRRTFNDAS